MAITTDDFNKIWASTSPLTPYSFSASQYKEGWNFIGSTPPSRQMWDFLQKNNDEKMQYLLNHFDNYLPLSGGTLTGVVNGVTPPNGDNSKKLATTEFVNAKAGNYLPLSGGTLTGDVDITGDLSVSGAIYSSDPASGENSGQVPTTAWVQKLVAEALKLGVLPGTVTAFSGTFKDGYPVDKNTGLVNREWHLCDGTNGTPDLRSRFIYGGDGTNSGGTGGEATHTLTVEELPKITPSFDGGGTALVANNTKHTATTSGFHDGPLWGSTPKTFSAPFNTIGGGQPHNNMPPYYVLAFIMKL